MSISKIPNQHLSSGGNNRSTTAGLINLKGLSANTPLSDDNSCTGMINTKSGLMMR